VEHREAGEQAGVGDHDAGDPERAVAPANGQASARISIGYSGKKARLLWPLALQ
jgi:hypothetical protein